MSSPVPTSPATSAIPDYLRDYSLGWSPWAAVAAGILYLLAGIYLGFTIGRLGNGIVLATRFVLFCAARIGAYALRALLPSRFSTLLYIVYWSVFLTGNGLFVSAWNATSFAWVDRAFAAGLGLVMTADEAEEWKRRLRWFQAAIEFIILAGVALGVAGVCIRFTGGPNIQGHGIVLFIAIGFTCVAGTIGFSRVGGLSSPEKLLGWSKEFMSREYEMRRIRLAADQQRADREHEEGTSSSGMSGSTAHVSGWSQRGRRPREDAFLFLDAAKRLRKIIIFRLFPSGLLFGARLVYQPFTVPEDRVKEPAYAEVPYYVLVVGFELAALAVLSVPWDTLGFLEVPRLADRLSGSSEAPDCRNIEGQPYPRGVSGVPLVESTGEYPMHIPPAR
ncbi:hypothetical protein M427DRAFT_140337 [Gonapodya prolifera JEL478]|uniref:Uncharacterized protein n=1 Tax=Gonapodya prolifera (strain JEL478) TaxID=1344416 RepID=A0A138ZZY9_GONPJ|nr:hypothetical protein M427DRAFT_140337 [Gonapodya prolifera JEL478]|eukprot:KXS09845.1 hypothetical protein M427DRAFT_140337 [Gonapodya prolifera JEL478]